MAGSASLLPASLRPSSRRAGHALIVPAALWTVLFCLLPLAIMVLMSFADRGIYGGVVWRFSLENYQDLWHMLYAKIFGHSLLIAGLTTIICLVLGYPLAYYMARLEPRWQAAWLLLIMIPFWTNFLVRTYAWMFILRTEGLLNTLLLQVGLIAEPFELLYTDGAVLLGLVYGYLPFMVLPLYASLEQLDWKLIEAATDLYATRPAVFRRILLPLSMPGVVAGCVLVFIPSLGAFITPDLLGGARSMMAGNLIQHEYLVARDWPLGSAVACVLMLLVAGGMVLYGATGKRRAQSGVLW
jgi:spermidine/putrescine transport system permease protein